MIEAIGLSRSFGGRVAVRDVSFRVDRGEVVGFLGPNGAGKTTTMRMLLGLLRPGRGDRKVEGPVGYLPESFAAYDALSVRANLSFFARAKMHDRSNLETEVARAMTAAGVADLDRRPFGRLSKGQRQRVGLATAILDSPPALVLDEPTNGLDPKQIVEARELIRSIADDGAAVLVSTHVLSEAASICDRVVIIVDGAVVATQGLTGGLTDAADLESRFLELVDGAGT